MVILFILYILSKGFMNELTMRIFYPQELDALFYNGFTIEDKFGNFHQSPFTPESKGQVLVCKARKS